MNDFLSAEELKTHLYEEIANEITRDDDAIIESAISTAVSEAEMYLKKYKTDGIFYFLDGEPWGSLDEFLTNRNPKLLSVVKDIAAWHLIRLSNPNIDLEFRRTLYTDAVKWLENVQKGMIDPGLLPYPPDVISLQSLYTHSNTKRNNHY